MNTLPALIGQLLVHENGIAPRNWLLPHLTAYPYEDFERRAVWLGGLLQTQPFTCVHYCLLHTAVWPSSDLPRLREWLVSNAGLVENPRGRNLSVGDLPEGKLEHLTEVLSLAVLCAWEVLIWFPHQLCFILISHDGYLLAGGEGSPACSELINACEKCFVFRVTEFEQGVPTASVRIEDPDTS